MADISREELERLLEKAKRDQQEILAKMTPAEREAAELRAQKLIEEDAARRQKLIEDAAAIAAGAVPAPQEPKAPKFCSNCGAPAGGGKFCTYCGSPLIAPGKP